MDSCLALSSEGRDVWAKMASPDRPNGGNENVNVSYVCAVAALSLASKIS